jgi:hypothetical protein
MKQQQIFAKKKFNDAGKEEWNNRIRAKNWRKMKVHDLLCVFVLTLPSYSRPMTEGLLFVRWSPSRKVI